MKNVHKIKHLVWKATISFINMLVHCGSGQLSSGEKFDVNGLWKCNVDVYNLTGNKFFYYEGICDFTLCAVYLKCMKCELV